MYTHNNEYTCQGNMKDTDKVTSIMYQTIAGLFSLMEDHMWSMLVYYVILMYLSMCDTKHL